MLIMKRFSASLLKEICLELNDKIKTSFISHISLISLEDIVFSFSFYKNEKLLISLNHNTPFISLIENKENYPTLLSSTNDALRKILSNAYIYEINQKENDRVITFTLRKTNELFEKETFYLVIELIPYRANLIILDEKKKILFATHYTSMDAPRPIIKGLLYEEVETPINIEEEKPSLLDFKKEANEYLEKAKEKRRKDQFAHLFTSVKNRIKTLQKKIVILEESLKKSEEELHYVDMGNLLYSISDESELEELIKDGVLLNYDREKSIKENAMLYFKKYKKAKSAIEHHQIEIEKAKDEIEDYQRIYLQLQNGDDNDLLELKASLNISKGKKEKTLKNKKNKISPLCIKLNNNKVAFGKTDEQNNILTFEKANRFDEFFHIKDYPGAHVVLMGNDFTNEERLIASEIALILSNKEDGDVQTALIKDVKKGEKLGKVILKNYTTVHLKEVRKSTKDLILSAKRM